MAIPNIIALFVLSCIVAKETKDYFDEKKKQNNKYKYWINILEIIK